MEIQLTVNGESVKEDVPENMMLSDFLRDRLGLTGTHVGCDTSQCGVCVVHCNGDSVKSCTMLAVQADGAEVTTIEGLESGGELSKLQEAFRDHHGLQCGFCTPGVVMSLADLLRKNPKPSDGDIDAWLEGHMCRCTGYNNIVKAAKAAAGA